MSTEISWGQIGMSATPSLVCCCWNCPITLPFNINWQIVVAFPAMAMDDGLTCVPFDLSIWDSAEREVWVASWHGCTYYGSWWELRFQIEFQPTFSTPILSCSSFAITPFCFWQLCFSLRACDNAVWSIVDNVVYSFSMNAQHSQAMDQIMVCGPVNYK